MSGLGFYLHRISNATLPSNQLLSGAHWVHLENPQQFNTAMRTWLNKYFPSQGSEAEALAVDDTYAGHVEGEL